MTEPESKQRTSSNSDQEWSFSVSSGNPASSWLKEQKQDALVNLCGTVVAGNYEILEVLGEGGMSCVFRAHHRLLNRGVAIKFIHPKLVHDQRTLLRFQQEAQAATSLSHPNICSVRECALDDLQRPYIVMDLIKGQSLERILKHSHPVSIERTLNLMIQTCRGLDHAHAKGVIHRDIKPANIIVSQEEDGSESAKIVDFGIAKFTQGDNNGTNLTQTGDVFGTPNYMSPEQSLGQRVDARTDIYAIGCVLYELLTGAPPFSGKSALEVLMMHVNSTPPAIMSPKVPVALKDVVLKCLKKDPQHRYASIRHLKEDLEAVRQNRQPPNLRPQDKVIILPFIVYTTPCLFLGAILLCGILLPASDLTVRCIIGLAASLSWLLINPRVRPKEQRINSELERKVAANRNFKVLMIIVACLLAMFYVHQWMQVIRAIKP